MLLGNKCDMADQRVISKERGEAISREHSITFMETSAKANINIEAAFMHLTEVILNKVTCPDLVPFRVLSSFATLGSNVWTIPHFKLANFFRFDHSPDL